MMEFKTGVRVVLLDGQGTPQTGLGTVVDALPNSGFALVEWDDTGDCRIESLQNLIPHQFLKAIFKHGPKLSKRAQQNI